MASFLSHKHHADMSPEPTKHSSKGEMTTPLKKNLQELRIIRDIISLATTTLTQIICAFVISQYDPYHTGLVYWQSPRKICLPPSAISSSCPLSFQMPNWILDPSSNVFSNSVVIFGIAVLASYKIQRNLGFENRVLGYVGLIGSLATGLIAIIERDGHGIKDYMPAFIIISLFANMVL